MNEAPPMVPQRWQRTEELFFAAEELRGDERASFLDRECAGDPELRREVDSLLGASGRTLRVLQESVQALAGGVLLDGHAAPGQRIGAYEIIRELGSGGMGVVFLARRADDEYRQLVAIKVLRFGMNQREMLLRFRAEKQILANLVHPNIARLLDGGVTEQGQPFLVMEYVDGAPLLAHCRDHDLSLRQRLELFRQVCAGVQCAHQNLVVHRDLKPANVLVAADQTPKLLDFGIAKLLAPEQVGQTVALTTYTERLMTPEYASPEQVRGEAITTATDVYSLGVVLYELLTGLRPLRFQTKTPTEIERVICEQDPPPPSSVSQTVNADLDTIILKAMDKAPARRYASARELSEDLRRYLDGYPIQARRDSWSYRAGKFVRRNRWSVAAVTTLVLLIVGFGLGMAWLERKARQERDRAEQVSTFLIEMFDEVNPEKSRGELLTARQLLDKGAARISTLNNGGLRARLLHSFGLIYDNLGEWDKSRRLLNEGVGLERKLHGDVSFEAADRLKNLSEIQRQQLDLPAAEKSVREALRIHEQLAGRESPYYLEALNTLALIQQSSGHKREAVQLFLEVLQHREKLASREHLETAVLSNLGGVYTDLGEWSSAEKYLRECIDIRRRTLGRLHPRLSRVLVRLGRVLYIEGKFDEAEIVLRETLAIQDKVYGGSHPQMVDALIRLGRVLIGRGDYPGAAATLNRAASIQEATKQDKTDGATFALGLLSEAYGDWDLAESRYQLVYEKRRQTLGPQSLPVQEVRLALGRTALRRGDVEDAARRIDSTLAARRQGPALAPLEAAELLQLEGELRLSQHRPIAAEPLFRDALQRLRPTLSDRHINLAPPLQGLGRVLCQTERAAEGEPFLREAIAILRPLPLARQWEVAAAEAELAACLVAKGEAATGFTLLTQSERALRRLRPPDAPEIRRATELISHRGKP